VTSAQEIARKGRIEPEAQTLAQLQGRMRDWLYKEAVPQWAEHGVDPRTMTIVEQRNLDGSPDLKAPRRFRVQARQIVTFCMAAERGWCGNARALLEPIIEKVTSLYWHRNGGWVFRIAADGSTSDDGRECYEQMFALLAFAGVYQTFRSQAALDWIDKTLALLDDHYYDAVRGGFAESIPWKLPRRQNPHMHYLEAMLALYEATDDRYFLTRATTVVTLFPNWNAL
jgi:mannose/cellobiose epimerase-like protein (N-acyl-D-glucosamine 2-epimerase family)